jgi:hypothetical protein
VFWLAVQYLLQALQLMNQALQVLWWLQVWLWLP